MIATLPQVASGLNPSFTVLKNLRLYMLWLLHLPFEKIMTAVKPEYDNHYKWVLVYAMATFC